MKTTKLQKIISTLLAVLIMVGAVPLTAITSSAATTGNYLGFEYMLEDGEVTITGYTGSATDISIPAKISGNPVVCVLGGTFRNNTSIKSVTVPDGVTEVGSSVFYGCTSLESVVLPEGIDTIFASTFYNCKALKTVNVPSTVTKINTNSFNGCKSLEEIVVPEGVTKIADYAFYNCTGLTSVTLPKSLETIGKDVFYNCSRLVIYGYTGSYAEVYAKQKAISFVSIGTVVEIPEELQYNILNKEVIITGYTGSASEIVIPAGIEGYPVTRIEGYAFNDCASLTSITLPTTLKSIGDWAFAGTGLTSIYIPDSVTEIGTCVFFNCYDLSYVHLPEGITYVPGYTFTSCMSLKEIDLPESIKCIDNGAFYASGITSITLPEGMEAVTYYSFNCCGSLLEIVIPESVTLIEDEAFGTCRNLKSVTIPASVTEIGEYAFINCPELTIYGYKGTAAESYAKNHSIPFALAEVIPAASITYVGEDEVVLEAGESYTPRFRLDPADATDDIVLTADSDCVRIEDGTVLAAAAGSATVTATATSGVSVSFTVKVREVTGFYLVSEPYQKEFIGDDVNFIGFAARVEYSDGTSYTMGCENPLYFNCDYISGEQLVEVVYPCKDGRSLSVYFTITRRIISELYVESLPYKTEYNIGDSFDETGLLVSLRFTDGTSMSVTNYKLRGFDSSTVGRQSIGVIWEDSTGREYYASFAVKVIDPNAIPIEGMSLADGKDRITIFPDDMYYSYYAEFEVYPENANDNITLVSDSSCISIDGMTIRPMYSGTANVTAIADSGVEYTFTVDVCDFSYIYVEQYPDKVVYNMGEEFDPTGLKLTAVFQNGETVDALSFPNTHVEYRCFDSTYEGHCEVQIVWRDSIGREYYVYLPVEIVDPVPRAMYIEVVTPPHLTVYDVGDPLGLQLDGICVMAYYESGETKEITDYRVDWCDLWMEGHQSVCLGWWSEKGDYLTAYFEIYVRSVMGITVTKAPDKTVYDLGEAFDPYGMEVCVTYSNGDYEWITDYEIGYFESNFEGMHPLEIIWRDSNGAEYRAYLDYEVRDKRPLATELLIESYPYKTVYNIGEAFDPHGLSVKVRYADGSERVPDDYYVTGFSSDYWGEYTLGVEWYNERGELMYTTFNVYIRGIESIYVASNPYKHEYNLGEQLDTSGLEVRVRYTDGYEEAITDYTISNFDSSVCGTNDVMVMWCSPNGEWYGAFFTVQIVDNTPYPVELYIESLPYKLEYVQRESLDLTGLVVRMLYTTGASEEITSYTVSGYNALKTGTQTVTLTADGGFSVSFEVVVRKAVSVTGLEISAMPYKTVYGLNESLDLSGLVLLATMSDESLVEVTDGYIAEGFDSSRSGVYTVVITYQGYSVSLDVSVILKGDVNGDGRVNALDTNILSSYMTARTALNDLQLLCADINGDGAVGIADMNLLKRMLAGSYTA